MSESKSQSKFAVLANRFFSGIGVIVLILIALFIVFTFATNKFLTGTNMYNLARATAISGICALGMSCAIFVGGIDLSIGSMVGATSMIVAVLTSAKEHPQIMSEWLAIPIALVFGMIMGALIGLLVNDGELPPFIASVGFQIILRAFTQLISNATIIEMIPADFKAIAKVDVVGIPLMAFIWFALVIIAYIMINHTRFGRNIFAVGSNAETARLSGISLRRTRCGTWMFSALMASIAGVLVCARVGSGMPTSGIGYEADAIASSVIGGASMSGGEGSIVGTFIGAIILQTIRNGGNLLGWNTFALEMIIGGLIIFCVLLDRKNKARK